MTTVSDITNTPLSGLNHIDALLDKGPDWNFQTTANQNVIYYTFSVASGTETSKTGQEAFSASQQAGARTMLTYLQQITGIEFRETGNGAQAQVHLANFYLAGTYTTGLCSWGASYSEFDPLTVYRANAYVYLDNDFRWGATNGNLQPGTEGYETLLHEMGHALGLKHPFFEYTGTNEAQIVLPDAEDNTTNTLMSYDRVGGNHSTFSPYDIAALNWLYGGDGLRGELGINSTTGARYITGSFKAETLTGTAFNDILQGYGGNDMIDGAEGTDTVVFSGARSAYTLQELADGSLAVVGADGTTSLRSVEQLRFADMSVTRASVADTVAPAAPVILVTQNAAGYARGSMPTMTGAAEAGSTVSVYINQQLVATALADATGLWSARSSLALADNFNYRATATATDVSGNVSAASAASIFHVDTIAPTTPSLNATLIAGGNQPVFAGSGEVGTLIQIAKITADNVIEIGRTTVGANGQWQLNSAPLPNGDYQVRAASSDAADNGTSSEQTITLTINNALNRTGTAGNDTFTMAPGSSAVEGGAGLDVAVYSGVSDSFVLERGVYGFAVRDAQGSVDNLINVERIKFDDTMVALDINGGAGQVYRLYQAAFDRVPDIAGLAFWIKAADAGTSLLDIAKSFAINKEYINLYANTSNAQFVTKLYEHVLDRPPEGAGYEFWLNNLTSGATDRDTVLASFSESPENQAQVIGSISNGIEYPFA
jgi:serralysin